MDKISDLKLDIKILKQKANLLQAKIELKEKELGLEEQEYALDMEKHNAELIKRINRCVAEELGFEVEKINDKTNKREYVEIRQICIYFVVEYSDIDYTRIAVNYGYSGHSSVITSLKAVRNLCETDLLYRDKIHDIKEKIELILPKFRD